MQKSSFHDVVRLRHSCRSFMPVEIKNSLLRSVLEDAQFSPSNCNTQPWNVHIVSGKKLEDLSQKLIQAFKKEQYSADFSFNINDFSGIYKKRQFAQGKLYYEALGITRDDKIGREQANILNYNFYGAPHAAFLFMPAVGDNVRTASDIGMYAQTFLLSLTSHGLAGVPQTVLGFFADLIRDHLGIDDNFKMLFGISFGYEDQSAKANSIKIGRDDLSSNVTFHR